MLFACLEHHCMEGFSGDLEFSHGSGFASGELLYWKSRGEVDTDRAASEVHIYRAALEARRESIAGWVTHPQTTLTVSFQCGKITKFLVRAVCYSIAESQIR